MEDVFDSEQQDPFLASNETRQLRPLKNATEKTGPSRSLLIVEFYGTGPILVNHELI
jgi:hypothetical protein